MSADRESEVLSRLARAHARLLATGELGARGSEGRTPPRSEVFRRASAEVQAATQARNRLLVELVGEADTVPVEVAKRLGLTGREAAHIVQTGRNGSQRLRQHVFGRLWVAK